MELFAIQERICPAPESQNRHASFSRHRVKNLGVLASIAAHLVVLSLLAVSPTAQTIPSFDIISVNIVQGASQPPDRQPGSEPFRKKQAGPIHPSGITEVPPPALVDPIRKQDAVETPNRTTPEQDASLTQDKAQPRIVLASAVVESGSGNLQNPLKSAVSRNAPEKGAAVAGRAELMGNAIGADDPVPMETAFGAPNAPAFIDRKMPVYPRLAERLGREGKVVLKLFIDEQGHLQNVQVVESTWQGFTDAALDAVRRSSFSPGRRNGKTVFSEALLAVRFSMK